MKAHPPEPIQSGWTTDNIGNVIAFIVPHVLDDMISDMQAGDNSLALGVLLEIQGAIKKLPSLYQPYADLPNTESESPIEDIGD